MIVSSWARDYLHTSSSFRYEPIQMFWDEAVGDKGVMEDIGGWFIGKNCMDRTSGKLGLYSISPLHGRAACTWHDEYGWVVIKGVGWTFGGPRVLMSPKDPELCFGLYDKVSAIREYGVSNWIQKRNVHATRVLGFAPIKDQRLVGSRFKSGTLVEPVLLYTAMLSPFRVEDLFYMNDENKSQAIEEVCSICSWDSPNYFEQFMTKLAENVAHFHHLDGCNDSLIIGNVTLAAEITDFEWITVPDTSLPLPFGDARDALEIRRQKELIYLYEIGIKLAALLARKIIHNDIMNIIENAFDGHVPEVKPMISALKNADIVLNY